MMALTHAETVRQILEYLLAYGVYYPGIDEWFDKVILEASSERRRIWVVIAGDELSGLAITKTGKRAKLCHISLSPSLRRIGVGSQLMRMVVEDLLKSGAQTVHLTAGDEIADEYGRFFGRCGFRVTARASNRYRRGRDELVWKATRESLVACLFDSSTSKQHQFCTFGVVSSLVRKPAFAPAASASHQQFNQSGLLGTLCAAFSSWTYRRLTDSVRRRNETLVPELRLQLKDHVAPNIILTPMLTNGNHTDLSSSTSRLPLNPVGHDFSSAISILASEYGPFGPSLWQLQHSHRSRCFVAIGRLGTSGSFVVNANAVYSRSQYGDVVSCVTPEDNAYQLPEFHPTVVVAERP